MDFSVGIYRRAAEMERALNVSPDDPADNDVEAADVAYQEACAHVPSGVREIAEKARLMLLVDGDTLEPAVHAALVSIRDSAGRMTL